MPVLALVTGLVIGGALFSLCLVPLITATASQQPDAPTLKRILMLIFAAGLLARLVLLFSEPILEDDYQRYLWDGAVVAQGINPYRTTPADAAKLPATQALGRLAAQSGPVIERINHNHLTTLYPAVAQGAFALAYLIKPWSVVTWRLVLLACDLTTFALVLILLSEVGRSPVWAALYWWHPLVLKELFNSAHMDAIVLPLVMAALLLSIHKRPLWATTALAFAAGAKLWPALLLPLILATLWPDIRTLARAVLIFAALMLLWAWPLATVALEPSSGFVAYFGTWQTNSALFPALQAIMAKVLSVFGVGERVPGLVVRGFIALCVASLSLAVALRPPKDAYETLWRAALVVAAVILLSPAQYPWYSVWIAPLLVFVPLWCFLTLAVTLPLYYLRFYLAAHDVGEQFAAVVVWFIWVPAWAALALEIFWRQRNSAVDPVPPSLMRN